MTWTWFENPGDYCLLPWCVSSVLKLSDGYVIGNILPDVRAMQLKDFQKKLHKILKI